MRYGVGYIGRELSLPCSTFLVVIMNNSTSSRAIYGSASSIFQYSILMVEGSILLMVLRSVTGEVKPCTGTPSITYRGSP